MRIAVVGAGVAGLVVARAVADRHAVVVFEADDRIGGHAHTVRVEQDGRTWDVDTGFVVFDPGTYPRFAALLDRLGVPSQPSDMSFSVRAPGIEYGGRSLGALLAQPANVLRAGFRRLVRDVLRFNREAAATASDAATLAGWLTADGYSAEFRDHYLVPMAAAIWSARPAHVLAMPAGHVVRFFAHHGLLRVRGQPEWRTIPGGAVRYVEALAAPLRDRVRTGCAVARVERHADGVTVTPQDGVPERFDRVVLAVPGSRALALLADPSAAERDVLGAFAEQENDVVLHTDTSLLPRARRAWSSWNVHLGTHTDRVAMTYDMSRLQRLPSSHPFCVTLNATAFVDPARVLRRFVYRHPICTPAAVAAGRRHGEVSGRQRTHYCGAYWGWGFHEDGVTSALAVCRALGVDAPA
ncbi:MAG: FAD-dependent oxidoreductase [bacterium]|nr:FAD-dependent oxidoreductase [bacterium]